MNKLDQVMGELVRQERQGAIPDAVQKRIDETLAALPEKRVLKRKRWALHGTVAATVLMGLAIGSGFVSPTMAEALSKLPLIGSVFEDFGDTGLKQSSQQGLTATVGKKVQVGKDSVEVKEILYDGERLTVGFVWKAHQKIKELPDFGYKVNGREYGGGFALKGGMKDDHTFNGILDIDVHQTLSDSFTLNFLVHDKPQVGKRQKVLAQLDIPVKKANSKVDKHSLNHIEKLGDTTLKVKEISLGPSSTELVVERTHKHLPDDFLEQPRVDYTLIDSRGIVLQRLDRRGSGNRGVLFDRWTFAPVKQNPTHFEIVYKEMKPDLYGKPSPLGEFKVTHLPTPDQPIRVPLGEAGTIMVNQIEFLPDKTKVHYQVKMNKPWHNPFDYMHVLELKDKNGRKYHDKNFPRVEDADTYLFLMELKPMKKEQIQSFVAPQVTFDPQIKTLKFKVELSGKK
ncbi:DUF4179 domain-containing protein [Laceyella putida]|uniref:DUF4179 domain-containing protein n=1 Tax=Laceyella putida TaxID=110101 RepID=A0ABW2RG26_9BACL